MEWSNDLSSSGGGDVKNVKSDDISADKPFSVEVVFLGRLP